MNSSTTATNTPTKKHSRIPVHLQCIGLGIDALLGAIVGACSVTVVVPALSESIAVPWVPSAPIIATTVIVAAALYVALGWRANASMGVLFVAPKHARPVPCRVRQHMAWCSFVLVVIAGWVITDISPIEFFSGDGLKGAGRIFGSLITPEFDILGEALAAMVETVFTALMATIVAVPIAFVLAFPAARTVMNESPFQKGIYAVLRVLLNITRSMEPIIWAIVFSVWVGIGPFAGMLALVVHTIASLTKQYSEQIEDIDAGPIEAILATGANKIHVLWYAVVPQCVIPFLSFTIYRWDINVRMATIIGFVGGGGIGTLLTQYQGLSKFHEVGTLVILITAVVWLLDVVSARIREALK
jgi:phosphonate transport system permease protein